MWFWRCPSLCSREPSLVYYIHQSFSGVFPSQRTNDAHLWYFLCCRPEQADEQTIESRWLETPWRLCAFSAMPHKVEVYGNNAVLLPTCNMVNSVSYICQTDSISLTHFNPSCTASYHRLFVTMSCSYVTQTQNHRNADKHSKKCVKFSCQYFVANDLEHLWANSSPMYIRDWHSKVKYNSITNHAT